MGEITLLCVLMVLATLGTATCSIPECKKSKKGYDYEGKVSQTVSGRKCQAWTSLTPHAHVWTSAAGFPDSSMEEVANHCRNPDNEDDGPWCYTTDPDVRWEYCMVPKCPLYPECKLSEGGSEYRGPMAVTVSGMPCYNSSSCRNADNRSAPWCLIDEDGNWEYCPVKWCKPSATCKQTSQGTEYVGKISRTSRGRLCQRWSRQVPHRHTAISDEDYPEGSREEASNFCRNPKAAFQAQGPWCYTRDPKHRWEFCDIPMCQDCKTSPEGRDYFGTLSKTKSGLQCQRWDSQKPIAHNMTESERFPDINATMAQNFCRNPDNKPGGPWCYTTSKTAVWEYCDIPICEESRSEVSTQKVKHVLHIGIDGLAGRCMKDAPGGCSNLTDRIGHQGAWTLQGGRTIFRSVSAPGWSTTLCGTPPEETGIDGNSWSPPWMSGFPDLAPTTGRDMPIPCVFQEIKSQDTNIRTASFYNWSWLRNMANRAYPGYVDYEVYENEMTKKADEALTDEAIVYLSKALRASERSYTFFYFGQVDEIGHAHSWCGERYKQALTETDNQVGRLLDTLDKLGVADEVLILVSTDHGGIGTGHGGVTEEETKIPMFVRGPGVRKDYQFQFPVGNMDLVPTTFYALGLKPSPWWRGRPMYEIFE